MQICYFVQRYNITGNHSAQEAMAQDLLASCSPLLIHAGMYTRQPLAVSLRLVRRAPRAHTSLYMRRHVVRYLRDMRVGNVRRK